MSNETSTCVRCGSEDVEEGVILFRDTEVVTPGDVGSICRDCLETVLANRNERDQSETEP